MKYRDKTPEQKKAQNELVRKWKAEHREQYRERQRNRIAEHREEHRERRNKYIEEHREAQKTRQSKYKFEHRTIIREFKSTDVNSAGVTKTHIRSLSRRILYKIHSKIQGYEIHHCFGYEDPDKFIYIPRTLHQQIHRLLTDNRIPADSNHWNVIRDIVNRCEEYTYIRS